MVVSDSTSRCDGARNSRTVARNCASTVVQTANRRAPASVSASARWLRRNSAVPSSSSSARIWRLMADWVTKRSAAALVNESWRAAASKEASRSSGGRRSTGFCMICRNATRSE